MMKVLEIDFETYSEVPLAGKQSVGLYNYCAHSSTIPLMLGYKLPGSKTVKLWMCEDEPMPEELREALMDPDVFIMAFNSAFERYILWLKLGIQIPVSRFIDPQVGARYLSLPGDLDEVSTILRLPIQLAKDKRGHELIKLFCEPQAAKKKRGEEQQYYRATKQTHPAEWAIFCEYCKQDIVAEAEAARRMYILRALPLPPMEQKIWELDQKVNDRGIPVDIEFVQKAYKLATRSKKEALDRQNAITGLENANSGTQLKPWLKVRGYPFNTLRKETVDSVLKDPEVKLTDDARTVLKARREASSTSYQKLNAIMRQISPDGRLRGQFIYLGSSRCGRWSGNAVQMHNLARPDKTFEDMENVEKARAMIYAEDYDGIKKEFGSVLLVVKNCIRTVFDTRLVTA